MRKVNKKQFYDFISPKDVVLKTETSKGYPYTTLFRLRYGSVIAKCKGSDYYIIKT